MQQCVPSWGETLMFPFGAVQRSFPVVYSTYEGATSVTIGTSSCGFNLRSRFISCVALVKLLLLCEGWFSHLPNVYKMIYCLNIRWWSRGDMCDAAEPGKQPSATWHWWSRWWTLRPKDAYGRKHKISRSFGEALATASQYVHICRKPCARTVL